MSARARIPIASLVACAAAVSLGAVAQEPRQQRFRLPGHGSLLLSLPGGWTGTGQSLRDPPALSLRLGALCEESFVLQVNSRWIDAPKRRKLSPESIKSAVRKTAADLLPRAVEKDVVLLELRGKETAGYYFSLTDARTATAPSEYKYLTQGIARTGPVRTVFTILQHEPSVADKEQALRLLSSATFSETNAPVLPHPQRVLRIEETDRHYLVSPPNSRIVLAIPRDDATHSDDRFFFPRGDFNFTTGTRDISLSGWFKPSKCFAGTKNIWQRDTLWRYGAHDVSFTKIGVWDAITFDREMHHSGNIISEIWAHHVQADTWIDLHLSVTSEQAREQSRAMLLSLLKTLEVREK